MSDYTTEIPYGYCHCGCGQKTKLSDCNNSLRGLVKGQPRRFVFGHAIRVRPQDTPINRFLSKINKNGAIHPYNPELGHCWEWQASRSKKGYGHFYFEGVCWQTHRLSWVFTNGNIPNGLFVLHSCDNPACVRPDHLFLGTNDDNMKDMVSKGRSGSYRGEESSNVKLTQQQVDEIRKRYAKGDIYQRDLGAEYGINQSHVSKIIRGDIW